MHHGSMPRTRLQHLTNSGSIGSLRLLPADVVRASQNMWRWTCGCRGTPRSWNPNLNPSRFILPIQSLDAPAVASKESANPLQSHQGPHRGT
eukprot:261251-Amphidinium_carterae.1